MFEVSLAILVLTCVVFLLIKNRRLPKRNRKESTELQPSSVTELSTTDSTRKLNVFYGTQTGTAEAFAYRVQALAEERDLICNVIDMKNFEPDDLTNTVSDSQDIYLFIISTYIDGQPPSGGQWFCKWLEESSTDFRVHKSLLSGMKYAVFGLGNSLYAEHYNTVGRNIDRWLHKLSATRIYPFSEGDVDVSGSIHGSQEKDFKAWYPEILDLVESIIKDNNTDITKNFASVGKDEVESDDDADDDKKGDDVVDVEDVGGIMSNYIDGKGDGGNGLVKMKRKLNNKREMVTPELRKALTKQGYRIVGSHSGVKLCRWTKSMLRGRGGCYKHTFYGIESHRCMETTPSLACANKCVFCWRHHTNPVGTEWRWKQDSADVVVNGAIKNHYEMIKQFKGVPGVKPDRFAEGFSIKHCALSLVGEPIMYPEINKFCTMLHEKGISSFLVTNAQFPDAIKSLVPVTQLYVSVDAGTKESLKKIDRPLFKDFWPRFIDSLKALSDKGQRTVYRLTVVKAWNSDEIEAYAKLVQLGRPDFIEIKGVTFCGDSKSDDGLTMKNVPWHEEVRHFVSMLVDMLDDYAIACEH